MLNLSGITIIAQIYESTNSLVYRAIQQQDQQPIILKILKENYPSPLELARYRREYEIIQSINLLGVIKAYQLQKYQNTLVIFLEDFGGESLYLWKQKQCFHLPEFLQIAIAISESLGEIHSHNIIHKDINPANIVFNPTTGQLKIIDFGISTQLNQENTTLTNPHVLEGTLPYMSPEQTGRMNCSLDYRTDFYSLGVTFYELLTDQLPFPTTDALELVHCHIAKQPINPSQLNPQIPAIVANIVMKLMAKTPAERYQSAFGLKSDLEKCLNQLLVTGTICNFVIAEQDISDKFQLPQKLYGREKEIDKLLTAFDRVTTQREIILIAGYSGIGKTALVQEIYKPITAKRGYFIAGKFDQYQRNIPYSAVVSAFQSLVKQLLTESEVELKQWQIKLLMALGVNGQVIIDVIPEIELIIGKQPTVTTLDANQSENRFNLVCQNFIQVFTQPAHPLVLFIDDLQWADSGSLKLIQLLMSYASPGLFLIGAYRDNEVFPAHPFMQTLDEIGQNGGIINHIFLLPLQLSNVIEIIHDTLKAQPAKLEPLAELVYLKTAGNPFFINEFLKTLYQEKLLKFDPVSICWQWRVEEIAALNITDNVVELMASKIEKLPANTEAILKLAACIGNQFDLSTLAITSKKNIPEIINDLQVAVAEGLVIPLGNRGDLLLAIYGNLANTPSLPYKFAHDRIQQAAYSLLAESEKINIHHHIGKILLKNTPQNKLEEKIFDIVNQLNFCINLISEKEKIIELAQLNLIAGKKAKTSAAYQASFNYLQIGIKLLAKKDRQLTFHKLNLELHQEAAEAAYFCGDFRQMEVLINWVINHAETLLDKVKVIEVNILALIAQHKPLESLKMGKQFLQELGVTLPINLSNLNILKELLEIKYILAGKKIQDLGNLPAMTDPYKISALRILLTLMGSASIGMPQLMPIIAYKQVGLLVKYGNCAYSPPAYGMYGSILCGFLGKIEQGYQFGELALQLLAKSKDQQFKAKVIQPVHDFIKHWKVPLRQILPAFLEAYQSGLESGDLEFAVYAAQTYCGYLYLAGYDLPRIKCEIITYRNEVVKLRQEQVSLQFKPFYQIVINLLGESDLPCDLGENKEDEQMIISQFIQAEDILACWIFYFYKLIICYLFEAYLEAEYYGIKAKDYIEAAMGTLQYFYFHFLFSLIQLVNYNNASVQLQKRILKETRINQNKIKKWAGYNPSIYLHKYNLVEAELSRIQGKDTQAMKYYDLAISLAQENEYIHEVALAYELAAKFYLSQGKEIIAKAYMQESLYYYQLWGATAKVKHLEKQYPQLLKVSQLTSKNVQIKTTGSSPNLDIATILKASQAISSEIELGQLLRRLMTILIENAGAQRGYLILSNQGKLFIEAEGSLEQSEVTALQSIPVENCAEISQAVVNYVARTQDSIALNHAIQDSQFKNDPYIKNYQPQSILCVPLINQGKLISLVYLENNLTAGVFTEARQELLNLLSAQIAISVENAQLYKNMAELNRAYERFVPKQFLQFLEKSSIVDVQLGDNVQLEMSVLFSDIRDFTTLSEKMTPEENFTFINSFLSQMEPAIIENHGFIDKYIGDAIMALFSRDTDNALKAAIAMLQLLDEYNTNRWQTDQPKLQIGIGINTGSLMLGTVGGHNRMDSTVISDAVNLASRVESLTKNYQVSILITEQTYSRLKYPFDYSIRTIDTVKVKGKSEAVTVYEVFDGDFPDLKEGKLATLPLFTEALNLYSQGKLVEAGKVFADCLSQNSQDSVARIYWQRCQI